MNKIILSGRLTQDPEMKQTPNNIEMAIFNVAVNRRRDRETTDFFRCVCFGQAAKYVTQYGSKGMSLELEGECQIHKYQDRNGNNQTTVNVVVDNLAFTSRNPQQQGGNVQQQSQSGYGQPTGRTQSSGGYDNGQRQQPNGGGYSQNNNGYAPRGGSYGQQQNNNGYGNNGYGQPAAPDFMDVPAGMDGEIPFN